MSTAVEPRGWAKAALHVNGWLVYIFFYAPIALLVLFSFSDNRNVGIWGGFTLDWYQDFFDSSNAASTIQFSTNRYRRHDISVILGTMSALAPERFTFRGKKVFDALLTYP